MSAIDKLIVMFDYYAKLEQSSSRDYLLKYVKGLIEIKEELDE